MNRDLKAELDALEVTVLNGTFPYIRLVHTDPELKPIVTAKKFKKNRELLRLHWLFIRQKLERELPAGIYNIECAYDAARRNVHIYEFIKPENYVPPSKVPEVVPTTNTTDTNNTDLKALKMSPEKIFNLVQENADLKAENKMLLDANRQLSEKLKEANEEILEMSESLDDEAQPSDIDKLLSAAKDLFPHIMPMADKYLSLKEQELKYKFGKPATLPVEKVNKKIPKTVASTQVNNKPGEMTLDDQANILGGLLDGTPEQEREGQAILDEIERRDPQRYATLCEMLGIEEEGANE